MPGNIDEFHPLFLQGSIPPDKESLVFFTRGFLPVMPLVAIEKFWSAPGGRYTAGTNHLDEKQTG